MLCLWFRVTTMGMNVRSRVSIARLLHNRRVQETDECLPPYYDFTEQNCPVLAGTGCGAHTSAAGLNVLSLARSSIRKESTSLVELPQNSGP